MRDIRCEICRYYFEEFKLDHPLHSSNWELPNKLTKDVCSVECRELALDEYDLTIRIDRQKRRKELNEIRAKLLSVKNLLVDLEITPDNDLGHLFSRVNYLVEE